MQGHKGFTLVELVVVIAISGVLSIVVMQFISAPIEAYTAQARRAALVDEAQLAGARMVNDVRLALPNSLRVGCGGDCVELLRAVSGGRYRALGPGDALSFDPADSDTQFDVAGPLYNVSGLATSSQPDACAQGTAACVVVYNTGFSGANAWQGDNIATLSGLAGSPTRVSFVNSAFSSGQPAFPYASPEQRFFLVDSPVSFICDTASGTLKRYEGYNRQALQTAVDSDAEMMSLSNPAEASLLGSRISDCDFSYSPGTSTRNGVLTIALSITERGESVQLLQQVRVSNIP